MILEPGRNMWLVAHELARTGFFANSVAVEERLRSMGYRSVDDISLGDGRERLSRICRDTREGQAGPKPS